MEWKVQTLDETAAVAAALLSLLQPGAVATVLALHGDLGAGKTTFVQQYAARLGVTEPVTSPTFVIQKVYPLTKPWDQFVHIDAYRIESAAEMNQLGFAELLNTSRTLVCIEWAERIDSLLPDNTKHLTFTVDGELRTLTLS
jgi:tRNA threonylcarbamoyladenosine biosynthesis protein TsaE